MKNYRYKIVVLFSIIAIVTSCNSSKSSEKETVQVEENIATIEITLAQFENTKMELGNVSLQTFTEGVKTNGYIDVPPASRAKVSAVMGGYVKNSPLLIGDKVKKGQLLLTLENPDFIEIQQNYAEIAEKLVYLKSENDRQKTLFDEKITSQKNYLKASSAYKSALALHKGLQQKLNLMHINPVNVMAGKMTSTIAIYAPISGSISNVYTNTGEFKSASEVLLEIINDEHKHLELVVFEKDILKINEEQVIYFSVPESNSKKYNASVHLIGKSIDKNRTVKVHGHLENEKEPFLVGMFVEAEIITNSIKKSALPVSSILEEDGNFCVLVLTNKNEEVFQFEKVNVTIGIKSEHWVEIIDTNNTLANKQLLIKGAFLPME